ncbi:hypothetical protein E3N88_22463 [Mikania micrantha]|uniref:HMA domain-containing protein n=1 Tax=Mikania micrantha TaxID=192012 RepID=A0A5N6NAG2_9ASTR|nr:hypothetical protein E3N88_22463 [Mikania micrantha]
MTDDKTKQKAIEAAADIYGVDSITAELKDQKLTVIGEMDTVAVVKKLKKVGKVSSRVDASGHHALIFWPDGDHREITRWRIKTKVKVKGFNKDNKNERLKPMEPLKPIEIIRLNFHNV